jgi:hypothetical protein
MFAVLVTLAVLTYFVVYIEGSLATNLDSVEVDALGWSDLSG